MIGVFNNNIILFVIVCYVSAVLVDGNFRRQADIESKLLYSVFSNSWGEVLFLI